MSAEPTNLNGEEETKGMGCENDPITGDVKHGTASDLTKLKGCFEDQTFDVAVEFKNPPSGADAAKLRRLIPRLQNVPVGNILTLIAGLREWSAGTHLRRQAAELASALRDQGFTIKVTPIAAPTEDRKSQDWGLPCT